MTALPVILGLLAIIMGAASIAFPKAAAAQGREARERLRQGFEFSGKTIRIPVPPEWVYLWFSFVGGAFFIVGGLVLLLQGLR